jgi:DNA-binding XRE family transcriptional regulator
MPRREHALHKKSLSALRKLARSVSRARLCSGLTRRQLAGRVGVSYATINHLENAENWPTLPVFLALCRVLKSGKVPLV